MPKVPDDTAQRTLIDLDRPIRTRLGHLAKYLSDDHHPSYPLSFIVDGRVRSYTRRGAYSIGEAHDLDLFNEDQLPPEGTMQPELW